MCNYDNLPEMNQHDNVIKIIKHEYSYNNIIKYKIFSKYFVLNNIIVWLVTDFTW
jgi:hypothetical protein